MMKTVAALAGISLITAPVAAQVRPADCVPVLPVMDAVAAVAPLDVVAEPAVAAATRRALFGLPLLLPLLAAAGGLAAVVTDDDDDTASPG